jgi:hypothetical protein
MRIDLDVPVHPDGARPALRVQTRQRLRGGSPAGFQRHRALRPLVELRHRRALFPGRVARALDVVPGMRLLAVQLKHDVVELFVERTLFRQMPPFVDIIGQPPAAVR